MSAKRPPSPGGLGVSPPPLKRKIESTTTSKAISTFFKPASQRKPDQTTWRIVNKALIIGRYTVESDVTPEQRKPRRIAAFDLDDTLIKPLPGAPKWAKSATGWQWWDASVPTKLKKLHEDGYQVVIISNQSKIGLKENPKTLKRDSASLINFKSQLTAIFRQLDLPISVYAATEHDNYRKPRTGMWSEVLEDYDLDSTNDVDMQSCFFVGDAAGRANTDTRRKDHACSDRDMAANIGIPFHTPEEYFLGHPPEPFARNFEPAVYLKQVQPQAAEPGFQKLNKLDLVIFCGSPGAGKSTFFWEHLKPLGYQRVNQDLLKTRDKCIKVAVEYLRAGSSVAVDNTNADPDTRAVWVQVARNERIPIRCVLFTASPELCKHNDTVRALNLEVMNPEKRTMLPAVAFRSFTDRYREPALSEGFQDITTIDFKFHGSEEQRRVWSRYWVSG